MPTRHIFTFKIGGMAGQGVKSAGLTFCKIATRSGYHIYTHTEYPSLVRGGHNVMQISIDKDPITTAFQHTDCLVALNQETITLHQQELAENGLLIFDKDAKYDATKVPKHAHLITVPLSAIAKKAGGSELMINTVALGVAMAMLGGEMKHLKDLIAQEFADKPKEITDVNQEIAQEGFNYAKKNFAKCCQKVLTPIKSSDKKMVLNGNEAIAYGAIGAGLQFASIYPMTPTSNVLHVLAANQETFGYIYKQPEDEISAICMTIGASHAGARSLTATSGGGFCLMAEAYGLAGMSETPIVIIEGMRGAPATGIPTWTEQGDLQFVLKAHQGDFPRIVLAASDGAEAFNMVQQAFNLAEKYQTPVLILVDKLLCENDQSYIPFDTSKYEIKRGKLVLDKQKDFQRYALSPDGISPRTIAGSGNFFLANSDEHDPYGYDDESIANRKTQMQKRMAKLATCAKEDMADPILFGPDNADVTIVSWGSNKGAILETLKTYPNVNFLHITWMNPFPTEAVKVRLTKAKYLLNVECNFSGQMAALIREKTSIEILDNFLKYDGRPIYPEELAAKLDSILKK